MTVRRRKQLALPIPDARQREAAALAIGHLELACGYIDILTGEDGSGDDVLGRGDVGSEALALATEIRERLVHAILPEVA